MTNLTERTAMSEKRHYHLIIKQLPDAIVQQYPDFVKFIEPEREHIGVNVGDGKIQICGVSGDFDAKPNTLSVVNFLLDAVCRLAYGLPTPSEGEVASFLSLEDAEDCPSAQKDT